MKLDVVTVFPEYLEPLRLSLLGKAIATGKIQLGVHDLRQWTYDVHRTVDDTPYGGGPGMVMRPEPWGEALDALATEATHLIVPSPAGTPFTHALATSLAADDHLLFACGRYEGIDQRVLDHAAGRMRVTEVSLGDYVLFGGEVAVLVIVEALTRLIPGVLGNAESLADESHTDGLLETPVYTKPAQWRGLEVPEVLRSGDHGKIARWRRDQALVRTATRRPDLLGLPGGASGGAASSGPPSGDSPSAGSQSAGSVSAGSASAGSQSADSVSAGSQSAGEASVTHPKLDKRDLATLAEAGFPVSNTDVAK